MTYDRKSYELAEHFLYDQETADEETYKRKCHELAQEIQYAVEAWFHDQKPQIQPVA